MPPSPLSVLGDFDHFEIGAPRQWCLGSHLPNSEGPVICGQCYVFEGITELEDRGGVEQSWNIIMGFRGKESQSSSLEISAAVVLVDVEGVPPLRTALKENACPLDMGCSPLSRVMFWRTTMDRQISWWCIYLPNSPQKWRNLCDLPTPASQFPVVKDCLGPVWMHKCPLGPLHLPSTIPDTWGTSVS